jgi:hypothetical protein
MWAQLPRLNRGEPGTLCILKKKLQISLQLYVWAQLGLNQ